MLSMSAMNKMRGDFCHSSKKSTNLKIFFATRPERHIRNILLHYKSHQLYRLYDIEN